MKAVAITIHTMAVTTAEVVACPTAAAFRPHCMPLRHPVREMMTPKTALWNKPTHTLARFRVLFVSAR